jgi:hypothetical protein
MTDKAIQHVDNLVRRVSIFDLTYNTKAIDAELHRQSQEEIISLVNRVGQLEHVLRQYADTFCQYSTSNEGCGKYNDDICSGCRARSILNQVP